MPNNIIDIEKLSDLIVEKIIKKINKVDAKNLHKVSIEKELLNLKEVMEIVELPRSTLYYYMNNNQFPKSIKYGNKKAKWRKKEIIDWLEKTK